MSKIKSFISSIYSDRPGEHLLKDKDYWLPMILCDPISVPLARFIARSRIKLHPNYITALSIPFAFAAGYMFFKGELIYGAMFYFFNLFMDGLDGKLARATKTTSRFGAELDYYSDTANNLVMYFGLWWSQYYLQGQWLFGVGIIIAHYMTMIFGFTFVKNREYRTISPRVATYYSGFEEAGATFFFGPLLGMVRIFFPMSVALQFVSYMILFIKQKGRSDVKNGLKEMIKKKK